MKNYYKTSDFEQKALEQQHKEKIEKYFILACCIVLWVLILTIIYSS